MKPGDQVSMNHPHGYATITGAGGAFVGWVPNGIRGTVFLLTPDARSAVVRFAGTLVATVRVSELCLEQSLEAASVA